MLNAAAAACSPLSSADPGNPAEQADELMVADYTKLVDTKPYRLLAAHLKDGAPVPHLDAAASDKLAQGIEDFSKAIVSVEALLKGRLQKSTQS